MNEADVRLHVRHAMQAAGYEVTRLPDCIVCPKCKNKIIPEGGRADLTASPTESTIYAEVKVLRRDDTSFAFLQIEDIQREWLDERLAQGTRVYLALGVIRPAGSRSKLEALYLVPWFVWECLEGITRERFGQESLPWIAGKGFSKEMQEQEWDIQHLLEPCLVSRTDGTWRLPRQSSAAEMPCGHPTSSIVSTDEGTHYCVQCQEER
jgi:hypothetical protein